MVDKKKISDELSEAVEAMDVSVDTDIDSQQRTQREQVLQHWSEEQARKAATAEDVELTDAHFQVIHLLRDYYLKNGLAENGRELDDMLVNKFSSQGGRKHLHQLFPDGPVAQGMRFAGLPVPAHSEDEGFGTAR